jgi:hypothetical protein
MAWIAAGSQTRLRRRTVCGSGAARRRCISPHATRVSHVCALSLANRGGHAPHTPTSIPSAQKMHGRCVHPTWKKRQKRWHPPARRPPSAAFFGRRQRLLQRCGAAEPSNVNSHLARRKAGEEILGFRAPGVLRRASQRRRARPAPFGGRFGRVLGFRRRPSAGPPGGTKTSLFPCRVCIRTACANTRGGVAAGSRQRERLVRHAAP